MLKDVTPRWILTGLLLVAGTFFAASSPASATTWLQTGAATGSLKFCHTQNSPDCAYDNDPVKVVVDIVPSGANQGKLRFKRSGGDDVRPNTTGCWQGGDKHTVICGANVSSIEIWGSNKSDTLRDKTAIPSTILGGQGNDVEYGGPGPDTFGGTTAFKADVGADEIYAGKGPDTILQQDGVKDKAIGCGNNKDKSTAGDGDLDTIVADQVDKPIQRIGCRTDAFQVNTWLGPNRQSLLDASLVNTFDLF